MIKGKNFACKKVEDYMIDEQRINNKKLVKSKKKYNKNPVKTFWSKKFKSLLKQGLRNKYSKHSKTAVSGI